MLHLVYPASWLLRLGLRISFFIGVCLLFSNCATEKAGLESCLYSADVCPEGTYCDFMTQRCVSEKTGRVERCTAASDCPDSARPLCSSGYCVPCTNVLPLAEADMQCKDLGIAQDLPTLSACVREGMRKGQCGECRLPVAEQKGVSCSDPMRPVCDGGACRSCRQHRECELTGLCNDGSGLVDGPTMGSVAVGQCVPKEQISFVDGAHCPAGGSGADGSIERPYCEVDAAVRAIAGRGGLVVVRPRATPGEVYAPFTISDGKHTIIVGPGRDGPPLLRGATASGAGTDVALVDLIVESGSGSAALGCSAGARLSLLRGYVDARNLTTVGVDATGCDRIEIAESQLARSRGPAVRIGTGARSYRVVNTLISGSASAGPSAVTIATGASGSFAWNTIINNGPMGVDGGGVSCEAPSMPILSDSLIVQNGRSNRTDPRGNPAGSQFVGCKLQRVVVGVDGAIYTAGPGAAIPAIPDLDAKLRLINTPNNGSCCVDKGGPCDDMKQDYYGNERRQGKGCDLGAHELR